MCKYLCINCKYNNHGFCKIKKTGGLKQNNIQYCNSYEIRQCFKKFKIVKLRKLDIQ